MTKMVEIVVKREVGLSEKLAARGFVFKKSDPLAMNAAPGGWNVTHRKSGYRIGPSCSQREARLRLKKLLPLGKWDEIAKVMLWAKRPMP